MGIVCWICSMYVQMYVLWENIYNLITEITIIGISRSLNYSSYGIPLEL